MTLNQWLLSAPKSQIDFIRKYAKLTPPKVDFTMLPFGVVKDQIPAHYNDGEFEQAIALALSVPVKRVMAKTEQERFELLLWLEREFEKINKVEAKYLERHPDHKLLAAGIRSLDILGVTNTIDALAGGDVTKWDEVRRLPYSVCFDKQLKNVLEAEIQKKMIEQAKNEQKKR